MEEQNCLLGWGRAGRPEGLAEVVRRRAELEVLARAIELEESAVQSVVLLPFPLAEWVAEGGEGVEEWRAVVSLGEEQEEEGRRLQELLRMKIRRSLGEEERREEGVLVSGTREGEGVQVRLHVREVTMENHSGEELGPTHGLLLLHLQGEEVHEARERLSSLLASSPRHAPPPLLLLTTLPAPAATAAFSLEDEVLRGALAEFDVITVTPDIFDMEEVVAVTEGVRRLVGRRSRGRGVRRRRLGEGVEEVLVGRVLPIWSSNQKERRLADLPDRAPGELLEVWHSALEHLLLEVGEQEGVAGVLEDLRLPPVEVQETGEWRSTVEQVLGLASRLTPAGGDCTRVLGELGGTLAREFRRQAGLGWGVCPPPSLLPWCQVVACLVRHRVEAVLARAGHVEVPCRQDMFDAWQVRMAITVTCVKTIQITIAIIQTAENSKFFKILHTSL